MDLKHVLEHHILDEVYSTFQLAGITFPFSKHVLMMLIAAAVLVVFLPLIVRAKSGLGLLARHALESIVLFIRLFANMIAGHIVILALLGLIFIFGSLSPALGLGVTAPVSIILVLFVSFLELFVAFLQAYIFVFLTAIFVGSAVHPH